MRILLLSWMLSAAAHAVSTSTLPAAVRAPAIGLSPYDKAIDLCERVVAHGDATASLIEVPALLQETFAADFERVLSSARRDLISNLTCLCPADGTDGTGLFGDELMHFQESSTQVGRQCDGGACGPACSRVTYSGVASPEECAELRALVAARLVADDLEEEAGAVANVDVSDAADAGDVKLAFLMLRLIERLRRMVAHEWGLAPAQVRASSAFVARIRADPEDEQTTGGGGDGPGYAAAHADESSYASFHYSAVLHLHSAGDGFEGGAFVFTDPPDDDVGNATPSGGLMAAWARKLLGLRAERWQTRIAPQAGRALLFSSGWENVHYVEPCTGERFALPVFFECVPLESVAVDGRGGDEVDVGRESARELCAQWAAGTQVAGAVS